MRRPARERAKRIRLDVSESTIQGLGVFTAEPIAAGTRIVEYTGEVISESEADTRYDDRTMRRHHTYLMSLDDGRCIDAGEGGNEARFINHSCEPNCEAVAEEGRVWIEAIRPIAAGEELTYDYLYERSPGDDENFYRCECGAPGCRGTMLVPRAEERVP
jgi:SET domain-containing protein